MELNQLTEFMGWCAIVNIGFITVIALFLLICKNFVMHSHQLMFKISDESLEKIYFKFLAHYKLVVIVFNIAPYMALKLMA